MSEFVTVARPYAKAAFDFAVEHQNVDRWQDMLAFAAEVTKNEQMAELLSGALAPETLAASFIAVCGEQLDGQVCGGKEAATRFVGAKVACI